MGQRINSIEQLNKQAAEKEEKNAAVEQQLPDRTVTVAERTHIYEASGKETNSSAAKGDFRASSDSQCDPFGV